MWAIAVPIAAATLCGVLALVFGLKARKTERQLGEVTRERDTLKLRILEQAELVALLLDADPSLDDLDGMLKSAIDAAADGAASGVPAVESGGAAGVLRLGRARET